MNTNDLPPAAKLASLIEAGRAANPDVKQGCGEFYTPHENAACALGFACLGMGLPKSALTDSRGNNYPAIESLGVSFKLSWAVECMNDHGKSLNEICESLREGSLANLPA